MNLYEIFNNKLKYDVDYEGGVYTADAQLPSGKNYVFLAEAEYDTFDTPMWNVSFSIDNKYQVNTDAEGKSQKDAFDAMSLTVDIMRGFIEECNPHSIFFSADADHYKLYKAIIKRLGANWGLVEVGGSNYTEMFLVDEYRNIPIHIEDDGGDYQVSIGSSENNSELFFIYSGYLGIREGNVKRIHSQHPDILKLIAKRFNEYKTGVELINSDAQKEEIEKYFGEAFKFKKNPTIEDSNSHKFVATLDGVTLTAYRPTNQPDSNTWLVQLSSSRNSGAVIDLLKLLIRDKDAQYITIVGNVGSIIDDFLDRSDDSSYDSWSTGVSFSAGGEVYSILYSGDSEVDIQTNGNAVDFIHPILGVKVIIDGGDDGAELSVKAMGSAIKGEGLSIISDEFYYESKTFLRTVSGLVDSRAVKIVSSDFDLGDIEEVFGGYVDFE